jgi:hypothetical protein
MTQPKTYTATTYVENEYGYDKVIIELGSDRLVAGQRLAEVRKKYKDPTAEMQAVYADGRVEVVR